MVDSRYRFASLLPEATNQSIVRSAVNPQASAFFPGGGALCAVAYDCHLARQHIIALLFFCLCPLKVKGETSRSQH